MADFYGCLESTSFRVKERAAFLADRDVQLLRSHIKGQDGFFEEEENYFSFGWYSLYPSWMIQLENPQVGTDAEVDISDVIQRHILPGDVCQIGISGNEKLRYIGGVMCWISAKGTAYFNGVTEWSWKLDENSLRGLLFDFASQVTRLLDENGKVV